MRTPIWIRLSPRFAVRGYLPWTSRSCLPPSAIQSCRATLSVVSSSCCASDRVVGNGIGDEEVGSTGSGSGGRSSPWLASSCSGVSDSGAKRAARWSWMASRASTAKRGESRIQIGVRIHLGGIKIQLLAPDQLGFLTVFDDGLEEALKDVEAIARA